MKKMKAIVTMIFSIASLQCMAQDADALVKKIKAKLDLVNNYEASGKMKTNVTFLKVPEADVKIYYKKPNQLKIKNEKGISFVPKGAVSINLSNIISGNQYSVIDAGNDNIGTVTVRVIKLLPTDDNADVVLSTLYIDEAKLVVLKAKTTTRENGSYQLEMTYGKYANYCLPDKLVFTFNTKDYKLPKGVTFDFDDGADSKKPAEKNKNGKAEISFSAYTVNKGVDDSVFK
jgi:outer membrane lipoprotein-sorting protein